jgi:hypothetical protein
MTISGIPIAQRHPLPIAPRWMSMTVQILVFHIAGTIDNCTEQQLLVHVRAIQLDYIQ